MNRKIVKQGSATMTISLPAPWIRRHRLKEGDELDLQEIGDKLEISQDAVKVQSSITIDTARYGRFTRNDLSHIYILGYDEVNIRFSDESVLTEINERLPDCIGFELIDQKEGSLTIKSISGALGEEYDNILRKVFLLVKEMAEGIHDAVSKREFARLRKLRELERMNNRFTSFLLRLLMKKGYSRQERSLQAYDMVQCLERLADEYKYLCDDLVSQKDSLDQESISLLKDVNAYFSLVYSLFYSFDHKKNLRIYADRARIKERASRLMRKDKDLALVSHMPSLIDRIYNLAEAYYTIVAH